MKIVVAGGNGFIGSAICRQLVKNKANQVISLSRSGKRPSVDIKRPSSPYLTESENKAAMSSCWSDSVTWDKADLSDVATFANKVKDADVVIHAVGVLLEDDKYKYYIKPNFYKDEKEHPQYHTSPNKITYESMNRDSCIHLVDSTPKSAKFIYISAYACPPVVIDPRYLSTKREAEEYMFKTHPNAFVLRPGFVYDPVETRTVAFANAIKAVNKVAVVSTHLLETAKSEPSKNISGQTEDSWVGKCKNMIDKLIADPHTTDDLAKVVDMIVNMPKNKELYTDIQFTSTMNTPNKRELLFEKHHFTHILHPDEIHFLACK